jgi:hypothetical protein
MGALLAWVASPAVEFIPSSKRLQKIFPQYRFIRIVYAGASGVIASWWRKTRPTTCPSRKSRAVRFTMSKPVVGKFALVTGAARCIGPAIAIRLAQDGAAVIINYASSAQQVQETVGLRARWQVGQKKRKKAIGGFSASGRSASRGINPSLALGLVINSIRWLGDL